MLPGGQGNPTLPEAVLSSADGRCWFGTSFATAFGTAIVSTKMSQQGFSHYQRDALLKDLTVGADKAITGFSTTTKFGHGIMRAS